MNSTSLRAFAPAKLNLGLEVLRRRRDGYHEIETLFQTLDFGDELEFTLGKGEARLHLAVEGLELPAGSENLVARAFALMRQRAGGDATEVRVKLRKRIPLGAGLGGGSSDAAATLLALNRLWRLFLPPEELAAMALGLGSDVPFFLTGGTAIGRGRGEILQPLPALVQGAFLLVNPGLNISSAWAYRQLKIGLTGKPYRVSVEQVKAFLSRFPAPGMILKNRLEDVIFPSYPVLNEIASALKDLGAVHVAMTGSGATMFGTFRDLTTAKRASSELGDAWQRQVARPRAGGVGFD